jgi:glycosyltransferase 2 family protein
MLTVCLLLFLSIFLFPSLLKRLLSTLTKLPLLNRWHERALITGEEIRVTSGEFSTRRPGFWIRVFLSTMLSWTGRYLVINMVLMAFLPLSGLQHLLIFAKQFILWVLMLVSPTPGASGVAEWAFSELLGNLAPSALVIVSLAIVWRLISYFPYLFIGSVLLPRWLKKSRN